VDNLALYIICLGLGGVGAWVVARWGRRFSLLDKADHRSSHHGVVPKGGGLGILAAFLLASVALGLPLLFWIFIGLISLVSFYGDRREISAKVRLCMQFAAGVVLLAGIFHWEGRGWPAFVLIPFFLVFVVGTANYYNFMDGINGIAGITGIVTFGLIALFGTLSGANESFLSLAGCMGFACLGFLPFNVPKARVFMGDVGSVLLGFVYAGLAVGLSHSLNNFMVLCAFLFPFYADELTTEYVRLRDGESLLKPHRRHIYQLLANEMRIVHWKVAVGYGILQVLVGVGALMIQGYGTLLLIGFLGACFAGFWGFGAWVRLRVDELATRGELREPIRFSDALRGRRTRMTQTARLHGIREIVGESKGAEKITDESEGVVNP